MNHNLEHQELVKEINKRARRKRIEEMKTRSIPFWWILAVVAAIILWGFLTTAEAKAANSNLIIAILECESSGLHRDKKIPNKMNCGDGGESCGIAQFKRETFDRFTKAAGFKNFYYQNAIHQLKVMNWAIDNGYGEHWTCYSKLAGKNAPVMDSVWPVSLE